MVAPESENLLLASLDAGALALLKPNLRAVSLKQKTVLQEPGTRIEHVYFPTSGMISLLAVLLNGDSIEIAGIGREGALGTKFGTRPQVSFARAVVQLSVQAFRIDIASFNRAAAKSLLCRSPVSGMPMVRMPVMRMNDQWFRHDLLHPHAWIQRSEWVLKNDLHVAAQAAKR